MQVEDLLREACGDVQIRWTKRSNTGTNFCVEHGGTTLVVKIPYPWYFQELEEEQRIREAMRFNSVMRLYIDSLRDCLIRIPSSYNLVEVNGAPVHITSDEGIDCEAYVREQPQWLKEISFQVVETIARLCARSKGIVGIDPRLSNFAFREDLVYFDLSPPLVHDGKRFWVGFPTTQDTSTAQYEAQRKYTFTGMLRLFRWDLMAIDRELEQVFWGALKILDHSECTVLRDQFRALPDARICDLSAGEKERLIDELPDPCVDDLRDIGARLVSIAGPDRQQIMQDIARATSNTLICDDPTATKRERYKALLRPFF